MGLAISDLMSCFECCTGLSCNRQRRGFEGRHRRAIPKAPPPTPTTRTPGSGPPPRSREEATQPTPGLDLPTTAADLLDRCTSEFGSREAAVSFLRMLAARDPETSTTTIRPLPLADTHTSSVAAMTDARRRLRAHVVSQRDGKVYGYSLTYPAPGDANAREAFRADVRNFYAQFSLAMVRRPWLLNWKGQLAIGNAVNREVMQFIVDYMMGDLAPEDVFPEGGTQNRSAPYSICVQGPGANNRWFSLEPDLVRGGMGRLIQRFFVHALIHYDGPILRGFNRKALFNFGKDGWIGALTAEQVFEEDAACALKLLADGDAASLMAKDDEAAEQARAVLRDAGQTPVLLAAAHAPGTACPGADCAASHDSLLQKRRERAVDAVCTAVAVRRSTAIAYYLSGVTELGVLPAFDDWHLLCSAFGDDGDRQMTAERLRRLYKIVRSARFDQAVSDCPSLVAGTADDYTRTICRFLDGLGDEGAANFWRACTGASHFDPDLYVVFLLHFDKCVDDATWTVYVAACVQQVQVNCFAARPKTLHADLQRLSQPEVLFNKV